MVYSKDMTKKRVEYCKELAFEYDVPPDAVLAVADILGPNEDYDGLVSMVEDYHYMFDGW